ncbi:MAG: radical SAM family heme chaperone HemW [Planctomycetota bacterium]
MNQANTTRTSNGECGLYVHIPFCETKCGYCDFFSVALKDRNTTPLTNAVCAELELRVPVAKRITTCFCGGGTPTLLPHGELKMLLKRIQALTSHHDLAEWTVEANPATVDPCKAAMLLHHGVTRVSLGAQSFFPHELVALERLHDPADVAQSVAILRDAGVTNLNIDLIFGIPGQTLSSWQTSLERAIELDPEHISAYGLTYEPQTRLTALRNAGRVRPCDEDLEADMFELGASTLKMHDYYQYELSNYARPGRECLHNLIYWRNQPYIGIGPSAAGCINGRRYKNVADIAQYVGMIARDGTAEEISESVDPELLSLEMIMMQMRTNQGLSLFEFHERTGLGEEPCFRRELGALADDELLCVDDGYASLTASGRLVADHVITRLVTAFEAAT